MGNLWQKLKEKIGPNGDVFYFRDDHGLWKVDKKKKKVCRWNPKEITTIKSGQGEGNIIVAKGSAHYSIQEKETQMVASCYKPAKTDQEWKFFLEVAEANKIDNPNTNKSKKGKVKASPH